MRISSGEATFAGFVNPRISQSESQGGSHVDSSLKNRLKTHFFLAKFAGLSTVIPKKALSERESLSKRLKAVGDVRTFLDSERRFGYFRMAVA